MISLFSFLLIINFSFFIFFENISRAIGLYDSPDSVRKFHNGKVANIGGFLFFINLSAIVLHLNFFDEVSLKPFSDTSQLNLFYFFSLIFFIIGYCDDKLNINSNVKLILFVIVIFFIPIFFPNWLIKSLNFSFYENSFNISKISYFFTILAFLLFINAFNMFDGINLQSVSYSILILIIFFIKSSFNLFYLCLVIPLLIFFYLNYKNKCFLGDNGTLLISFIFSFLFIHFHNNEKSLFADEIFLIMLIPGLDMLRLFISRFIKRLNPFHPDRNHIHHLLVKKFGSKLSLAILFALIFLPIIIVQFYNLTLFLIIVKFFSYFYLINNLTK